jgi:hypothetical protein
MLIALVAFVLAAFVVAMAQQTPAQNEKKQGEVCCAMESCCGKGDSCAMKTGDTANSEAKDACCSDSCDMANHAKHEKHDKKDHPADGSCCNMKHKENKQKDTKKEQKAA